jgi:hypothetical protein
MYLPASPTARRREEQFLIQARLAELDRKVDRLVAEVGAVAPAFPQASDIDEVGKALVEGRVRLPKYARVTVTTEIEERKDPISGTSTILNHLCDQLCAHQLQPMSVQAAIEVGLLVKLGGRWLFSDAMYKRLVPPDPRLIT